MNADQIVVMKYAQKFSKALRETPGKADLFRIAIQAGDLLLNYTAFFENISVMIDKRNSPLPVKLFY